MCKHENTTIVKLCKPREYSRRTEVYVDSCIASLVQLLNNHGVCTTSCCCGHAEHVGTIFYSQDGKEHQLKLGMA